MFVNLCSDSKAGAAFRNHNFHYLLERITEIDENLISCLFAEGYRTNSWDPELDETFEFSLSERACECFLRLYPPRPMVARDYYLSKLFQYLKISIDEALKYCGKWQDGIAGLSRGRLYRALESTLDEIHPSLIAHLRYFDWFLFQRDLIRCGNEERMGVLLARSFRAYLKNENVEGSASRAHLAKERKKLQDAYKTAVATGTFAKIIRRAKNVDPRDFRRWQQGKLPNKSIITKRIERAFNDAIASAAKSRA